MTILPLRWFNSAASASLESLVGARFDHAPRRSVPHARRPGSHWRRSNGRARPTSRASPLCPANCDGASPQDRSSRRACRSIVSIRFASGCARTAQALRRDGAFQQSIAVLGKCMGDLTPHCRHRCRRTSKTAGRTRANLSTAALSESNRTLAGASLAAAFSAELKAVPSASTARPASFNFAAP